MLQVRDLIENVSDVATIGNGVFRCQLDMPRATTYFYVKPAVSVGSDLLVVSEDRVDDAFAALILNSVPEQVPPTRLCVVPLSSNAFGFPKILLAPPDYHAYFKGVLDEKRKHLVLCLPVHECEFSGQESAQEFALMRRDIIPSLNWERRACPKIVFRFDNPKTRSGTGDREVFVKRDLVLRELDNLDGVAEGFLEIQNFRSKVIEILSPEPGRYVLIANRDDATRMPIEKDRLVALVDKFLVDGDY